MQLCGWLDVASADAIRWASVLTKFRAKISKLSELNERWQRSKTRRERTAHDRTGQDRTVGQAR